MSAHAMNPRALTQPTYSNLNRKSADINKSPQISIHRVLTEPLLPSQQLSTQKASLSDRIRKAIKPDLTLFSVTDLTPNQLRHLGNVQGVIFDLDYTLKPLRAEVLTPEVVQMLKNLQNEGFKLGIVSNNPSEAHCNEARRLLAEEGLDIPFIAKARKPTATDFKTMIKHFDLAPEQVAMVGDSPICDVIGSKKLGMKAVKAKWFLNTRSERAFALTGDVVTTLINTMRRKRKTENPILGVLQHTQTAPAILIDAPRRLNHLV